MEDRLRDPTALDPSQRAAATFGFGMAAMIMTVLGFSWLGWGFASLGWFTPALWILFYSVTLCLLTATIRALRKGKALMKVYAANSDEFWAKHGKQFKIITVLEGAGCGVVVLLTIFFHRLDLLAAGISLVVGLHFLPLARLLRFNVYYWSGGAIILCDLLIVLLFNALSITASVGTATGVILWATALYALLRSVRFSRETATA